MAAQTKLTVIRVDRTELDDDKRRVGFAKDLELVINKLLAEGAEEVTVTWVNSQDGSDDPKNHAYHIRAFRGF